jgi:hypothetical protein
MMGRMKRLAGWTGAVLLGLPVALLAHVATYGNEHLIGGSAHALLIEVGFVLATLAGVVSIAACLLSSASAESGSVLAARLSTYLPGWFPLALCALGWFLGIERCESAVFAVAPLTLLWLTGFAFLAARGARAAARAIATLAVAWFAPARSARAGIHNLRFAYVAPPVASRGHVRRRFARPPPLFP